MKDFTFKRPLQKNPNGSFYFHVPIEIIRYLELNTGDPVEIMPDKGTHGRFASFWNPKKQGN